MDSNRVKAAVHARNIVYQIHLHLHLHIKHSTGMMYTFCGVIASLR